MDARLSLSVVEITVLMLGAFSLGVAVIYFIMSRSALPSDSSSTVKQAEKKAEEWKQRYFGEIEFREKEQEILRKKLQEAEENVQIYSIEAEETRKENRELRDRLAHPADTGATSPAYLEQLREVQSGLQAYNEKINRLLSDLDVLRAGGASSEAPREAIDMEREEWQRLLSERDLELQQLRENKDQNAALQSRLELANEVVAVLRDKIEVLEEKLQHFQESQVAMGDLQRSYERLKEDHREQSDRFQALREQKQELAETRAELEQQLREAILQHDQLQKKLSYVEELNHELTELAAAGSKLEAHVKRIAELESMLHLVSEERDWLARQQQPY